MLSKIQPKFKIFTRALSLKMHWPTRSLIIIGLIVFLGVLAPAAHTQAWGFIKFAEGTILDFLGGIASIILWLLGTILGILIEQLIKIADYNHFIDSQAPPAIHIGWGVVRDFSNMLFIIALMVIAFGTILKIQTYHARSALVKLIIMAILINFSMTITGLFIDFAQVVMNTFVNGFRDSAAIVLTVGLNVNEMTSLAQGGKIEFTGVVASMIMAVAMLIVACTVVLAMVVVLLFRIIMIWVLVILSPIAYIATVLPNTQKYASQWWSSLGKNLISGPLLAFFLWLALSVIATSASQPIALGSDAEVAKGVSEIMSTQNIFNYIITISLLIMGLMMTQALGVMGGQFAGSMVGRLRSAGIGALKSPLKAYAFGARKLKARTGVDVNPASIYKTMKAGFARKREQEEYVGMVKAGQRLEKGGFAGAIGGLGAASWVDNYAQGFLWQKGIRKAVPFKGKGRAGKIKDMVAEEDRQKKEIERLERDAQEKNADERYLELKGEEKMNLEGEKAEIEANIEAVDREINKPELEAKKREATARKIRKRLNNDVKEGKLDKEDEDYKKGMEQARKLEEEAVKLRRGTPENLKELRKRKQRLEGKKAEKEKEIEKVDTAIEHFSTLKDPSIKMDIARKYLSDQAARKAAEIKRIKEGGLTDAQKQERDKKLAGLTNSINILNKEIKDLEKQGIKTDVQKKQLARLKKERQDMHYYEIDMEGNINRDKNGNPKEKKGIATKEERKQNEDVIKKLQEEETNLENDATKKYITEDQRIALRKEAERNKIALQEYSEKVRKEASYRPIDFLAQQERRRSIQEESRKYDTTNEDELIAYHENALRRGNVTDAAAVALQAARVGHLNELVNATRASGNWYENPDGNIVEEKDKKEGARLVFKKGDFLSAGIEGLHVYMREIFDKKFKYGRQATLALENDLSNIAETINHWTFGQAVGSRADGQFYQRSRAEQGQRAYIERSKRDFENLYRQGNRLSIGTEEWIDPRDHSKGRKATLNEYAAIELMNKWEKLLSLANRGRFNASASEHIMQFNGAMLDQIQKQALASGKGSSWRKFRTDLETLGGKEGEIKNLRKEILGMRKQLKKLGLFKT